MMTSTRTIYHTVVTSMTGHECIWRKIIGTLSSVLTPGVMVQNCSLSVPTTFLSSSLCGALLVDLNHQTILEMRFALSEDVARSC